MKKIILSLSLLLFLGGGCANTPSEEASEDIVSKPADAVENNMEEVKKPESLVLKAKIAGNATVEFEWEVPKNLESKDGYRIVYSTEPNPTYPSTWWYERGPAHREKVWTGLPLGTAHFRLCAVVDDKCGEYSNDVEVEIK